RRHGGSAIRLCWSPIPRAPESCSAGNPHCRISTPSLRPPGTGTAGEPKRGRRRRAAEPVVTGATYMNGTARLLPLLPCARAGTPAPVRVTGKFFFAGDEKFFVKGVTYGPFPVGSHGRQFPEYDVVVRDFRMMAEMGATVVRVFTVPPVWLLDRAAEVGLRVLVGLPWSQHVAFLDSRKI